MLLGWATISDCDEVTIKHLRWITKQPQSVFWNLRFFLTIICVWGREGERERKNTSTYEYLQRPDFWGSRVRDSHEPPYMGAKNQTPDLWKNSTPSWLLSCLLRPEIFYLNKRKLSALFAFAHLPKLGWGGRRLTLQLILLKYNLLKIIFKNLPHIFWCLLNKW